MPVTKSAKKADRASNRKKVFNIRRKNKIVSSRKDVNKLLLSEKPTLQEVTDALSKYYSALDKAAKTNYIEKNKASRLKSRLSAKVAKLGLTGTVTAKTRVKTVAKKVEKKVEEKAATKKTPAKKKAEAKAE
ncbi:MAG: 30S ribosomal protein S20 [bacterium]